MLIFRRLVFAILFLLATIYSAEAANRFWKVPGVTGAIVSIASPPQVRLTVASTTGMTTGDVRVVSGIVGTTEANGTWTITVIDGTHVDLQGTTFANLYTSGGVIYGKWDGTNTNNWVTTSGGTNYGQTVPTSVDVVSFDGSSGGGIVTVNATINVSQLIMGVFTGTLDFSANNNNVTVGIFNGSGTGIRALNMGNGTWTITGNGISPWDMTTTTNLTFNANSSTLRFTGLASALTSNFLGGGLTYNIVSFGARNGQFPWQLNTATIATLQFTGPQTRVIITAGETITITSAAGLTAASGIASGPISIGASSNSGTAGISVASGTVALSWVALNGIAFSGGATFTAPNSFDFGSNTGITITAPAALGAGGGTLIGG